MKLIYKINNRRLNQLCIRYRELVIEEWFYILSIIMLTNGSLFNFIFRGTPLTVWRQLICLIGFVYLFKYLNKYVSKPIISAILLNVILFGFLLILIFRTILLDYNIPRVLYAVWIYFSGIPFIIFPFIYLKNHQGDKISHFYNLFILLGCFQSLGILIDYLLNGAITLFFLISANSDLENYFLNEGTGRFYFLSESPTTFGVYFCFCLVCSLYQMYCYKNIKYKYIYFYSVLFLFLGAWLTGSRQIVLAMGIIVILTIMYYILRTKEKKSHIYISISIFILVCAFSSMTLKYLDSKNELSNRYESKELKEDKRYSVWKDGFQEVIVENPQNLITGNGIGYTVISKALPNEKIGYHYENTYIARVSESGILGFIILMIPLFLFICRNKFFHIDYCSLLIFSFFLSWIIISFISPNGSHQISQMTLYIVIGSIATKKLFNKKKYGK